MDSTVLVFLGLWARISEYIKALGDSSGNKACALCQIILNDPSSVSVLVTSCLRHLLQKAFPDYRERLYHSVLCGHHPPSCFPQPDGPRGRRVWGVCFIVLSYLAECWAPDRSSESILCVKGLIRKAAPSREQGTGDRVGHGRVYCSTVPQSQLGIVPRVLGRGHLEQMFPHDGYMPRGRESRTHRQNGTRSLAAPMQTLPCLRLSRKHSSSAPGAEGKPGIPVRCPRVLLTPPSLPVCPPPSRF